MRCSSLVSGLLAARAAAQLATFKQCDVRIAALERGGGCLAVDAAAVNATRAPPEAPVTERALPVAIFDSEEAVKVRYLRRWL